MLKRISYDIIWRCYTVQIQSLVIARQPLDAIFKLLSHSNYFQMPPAPTSKPPTPQDQITASLDRDNQRDTQKILKWCLIVGLPAVLIIVVIAVVVGVFSAN